MDVPARDVEVRWREAGRKNGRRRRVQAGRQASLYRWWLYLWRAPDYRSFFKDTRGQARKSESVLCSSPPPWKKQNESSIHREGENRV
jgi:hypothetical protein